MYDPEDYKNAYEQIEHGKARLAAMRAAIEAADANHDRPYQFYFRTQFCRESNFYLDSMDMMVMFPELLTLADKYPDTPTTRFNNGFTDSVDHVLWCYKWVLGACVDFYQIPMEDCQKFFEDFKRRSIAYGYNLKPYFRQKYYFYYNIDRKKAEEAFYEFERLPRDGNADCRACERNTEILFYLNKGNLKRAEQLAKDIENQTLRCGNDNTAWLRLKGNYLDHYMKTKNLEEALKYCRIIERSARKQSEHQRWDDLICCYAHADIGKALKLYKEHWKELREDREPSSVFDTSFNLSHFFKLLSESRKRSTVNLPFDSSFPLYREDGQYKINNLYVFYHKTAEDIAKKMDARNGVNFYQDLLEKGINLK